MKQNYKNVGTVLERVELKKMKGGVPLPGYDQCANLPVQCKSGNCDAFITLCVGMGYIFCDAYSNIFGCIPG
ncbi:MAG: hypothetical protein QM528_07385 [Phycisphaerales bacterium]|nr:hypothetical protein [Phycisphaerales bacterium]